jgi:hypothetical protein
VVISKQNLSQQRAYLDWMIFKDANKNTINEIYSDYTFDLEDFKGFKILTIDGSQVELPKY